METNSFKNWWDSKDNELRRDPIEAAQQLIQRPVSTEELYARTGLTQPTQETRPDYMPMDEVPPETIQTSPISEDKIPVVEVPFEPSSLYKGTVRQELFDTEKEYFKQNPNVGGMMTEDNKIIINPYSNLTEEEKQKVVENETIRLGFKENNIVPDIELTDEQRAFFKGTPYEKDEDAMKQTIIARIMTGDPSAKATEDQFNIASGYRYDGSKKSMSGFLGPIQSDTGKTMTEFSIDMKIKQPDGSVKEMRVPSLVPGLTQSDINLLAKDEQMMEASEEERIKFREENKEQFDSIFSKAKQHAESRLKEGKSVYYQDDEPTSAITEPIQSQEIKKEESVTKEDIKDLNVYMDYIAEHEGFRSKPYKATKDEKYLTIGFGHYGEDVSENQPEITREQGKIILKEDIKVRLAEIKKAIPNFDKLSLDLRKNLISSWFRGALVQSPKTRRLINEGKYKEAAKEFLDNDEYRNAKARDRAGVVDRMNAVANALMKE